ncbi:MAG: C69 family dipeptidase [Actinomycetota bacterium]|nr:C69 family dipeptidase [Actinomycetota bacterium]
MCDTIVVVRPEGVLFAKNSDRDPNEAQIPEWHPATDHSDGATVQTTYLEIPQVAHTYATLISRPFWMWGAEIGTNEHGVTIGNEAVFTSQPLSDEGLTGMDMIRLALERSSTAEEAVGVIVELLDQYGQGGGAGYEKPSFNYHNSFIVADPTEAWVLETAGALWATEHVRSGVRTISNGLTIPGFADDHRKWLETKVSACDIRTRLTADSAHGARGPRDLIATLRSHGPDSWPRYRPLNGTLSIPCMHGGGIAASSSSVAGWVSELATETHWISATSAQCLSLFNPVRVDAPVDIGTIPGGNDDGESLWWRHERMARTVMRDPDRLAKLFLPERDAIESLWFTDPPEGQAAFDEGSTLLDDWASTVAAVEDDTDVRPIWAKRYWEKRDRAAEMRW